MKKVWKWVIGIVVGLLVVALVVGGAFFVRSHFSFPAAAGVRLINPTVQTPGVGKTPGWDMGRGPRGFTGRGEGMQPFGEGGWGRRGMHMGMMGFGWMPFGGVLGGLVLLGFLALAVLGIIWLVNRSKPTVAVVPSVAVSPCKKCGQPVQTGWTYCPNCGKKV
jgi:hypothetical protein